MIAYFHGDVPRINHALKVYGFASCIARREGLAGRELQACELAAVLHDIGIPEAERKHGSGAGPYQEMEGPAVARKLMASANSGIDAGEPAMPRSHSAGSEDLSAETIDAELMDRVCYLVGHHHSYACIDGPDFQVLVEADFLVNIDEDGMSADAIRAVRKKYFSTRTGIELLEGMYGLSRQD